MKRSLWLLLAISSFSYGQYNEFKVYENGLIYDERTMHQLGVIVDSLHLKFKTCDLSHPYYSYAQGLATVVRVPSKAARKQIQGGITLADYIRQYSKSDAQKIWALKSRYSNYKGKRFIEYSGLPYGRNEQPSVSLPDIKANDKVSGWVISSDSEYAMFLEVLRSTTLPFEYARLVQYVDCMIDTTAEIYFPIAKGRTYQQVSPSSSAAQFIEWANQYPGKPKFPEYDDRQTKEVDFDSLLANYFEVYQVWDSARLHYLDDQMSHSNDWREILQTAVEEGMQSGNSSNELEFYVARYLSKEDALKLMRSRKVVGGCSQDQGPRYHAMNICRYAAETSQWDIFLRSHLDIMNDRFERVSDGSYAWAGRKTYLKELESLDINAIDLLLGTSLRVQNVSKNHYIGSINRVGRALADADDKDQLESRLLGMMQDDNLDLFNRLLMMYLFDNYYYNLDDESRKSINEDKLKTVAAQMPEYIKMVWNRE